MDENNAIRAITIGVSTFIAILTITAVMMYYNTAKATVQEVGSGPDLYNNYASYIRDILVRPNGSTITGADAINLINYFYNDELVEVNLVTIKLYDGYTSHGKNVHTTDDNVKKINLNVNNRYTNYINLIRVVQDIKINTEQNNGKTIITLTGIN